MKQFLIALLIGCTSIANATDRPNLIFIMLDDLGYSQIEAFARNLSESDLDPAMVDHAQELGYYTIDDAMRMVQIASPTLSRLADEGATFHNAMANSNLCAPSRLGMATGTLQNRWGIYRNIDASAHGLKPHSHLAERLDALGYATAHIGKWHIGERDETLMIQALKEHAIEQEEPNYYQLAESHPRIFEALKQNGYEGSTCRKDHALNNGFDYYFGYNQWESPFYNAINVWENFTHAGIIKDYNTDVFTDKALQFIEKSLKQEKPFYVQLHYHAVHHPLGPKAPEIYQAPFNSPSPQLNNFYAHIYAVDQNIQRILDYLASQSEASNTMIVFTSDNGGSVGNLSPLPGNAPYSAHKGNLKLGGLRVPLFFSWPEKIDRSRHNEQLVSTLDILPTLIDAAGGTVPDNIDGRSLVPWLLNDNEDPVRSHFFVGGIHARAWGFLANTSFFEHNQSREKAPSGYIVADNQYVLRYVSTTIPNLYKDAIEGIPAYFELYDYRADPGETNNLIQSMPEKAESLKEIWQAGSKSFVPPIRWQRSRWDAIMGTD